MIKDHDFYVVSTNMEKYVFSGLTSKINNCRIDLQFNNSLQFLNTSLQKFVESLPIEQFSILRENMEDYDISLLLQKGIYPYAFMTILEKIDETTLPSLSAFHSSSTDEDIFMLRKFGVNLK